MSLPRAGVALRWDEGIRHLHELEEDQASSIDGIMLNQEYMDYRHVTIACAIQAVEEEAQLMVSIARAGWDTEEAEAAIEDDVEAGGLAGSFDPGVAGLVLSISALGGTPISSCNGGLVGISNHQSEIPHILFTAPPEVMDKIIPSAIASEVGLIFNNGYAEAFADHLPNLHVLARSLLGLPPIATTPALSE